MFIDEPGTRWLKWIDREPSPGDDRVVDTLEVPYGTTEGEISKRIKAQVLPRQCEGFEHGVWRDAGPAESVVLGDGRLIANIAETISKLKESSLPRWFPHLHD